MVPGRRPRAAQLLVNEADQELYPKGRGEAVTAGREPVSQEAAPTPPAGLPRGESEAPSGQKGLRGPRGSGSLWPGPTAGLWACESHGDHAPGGRAVRTDFSLRFPGSGNI